jgi:outer membrane lipoprotein SlyB
VSSRVTAIEPVTETAKPSGAGAVIGGVLGAAVGNQIGKGDGRNAATVVGGVGGAVVGHNVQKRRADPVAACSLRRSATCVSATAFGWTVV